MHPDSALDSAVANMHGDLQPDGIHRARHGMDVDPRPLRGLAQRLSPRSKYSYTLSGLPGASSSTGSASRLALPQNPAGCNLASPNTGSYSKLLCFADFTGFTNANSNNTYCPNRTGQHVWEHSLRKNTLASTDERLSRRLRSRATRISS